MTSYEQEALDIANAIEAICDGRPTACSLMALSMVIGVFAATADRPDFDGLMRLIERGARETFEKAVSDKARRFHPN